MSDEDRQLLTQVLAELRDFRAELAEVRFDVAALSPLTFEIAQFVGDVRTRACDILAGGLASGQPVDVDSLVTQAAYGSVNP